MRGSLEQAQTDLRETVHNDNRVYIDIVDELCRRDRLAKVFIFLRIEVPRVELKSKLAGLMHGNGENVPRP